MKKLIIVLLLSLTSVCSFSGEPVNVISDLYQRYSEYVTLSTSKELSSAEKASYAEQAKNVLQEAKFYGRLAGDVSIGTYRGIEVPPAKWVALYNTSRENSEVVDVYNFKFTVRWPCVLNGIRTYKTTAMKGWFVIEYETAGTTPSKAYAVVKNDVTKGIHYIDYTGDSSYWLLGVSNKYISHIEPSVFFEGAENDSPEATTMELHEKIKKISLSGSGSLGMNRIFPDIASIAPSKCSCNICTIPTVTPSYCIKLMNGSGYVTGIMDCECPEDEEWNHTVYGSSCGAYVDGASGTEPRSHEASFGGIWAMSFNIGLSVNGKNSSN